MFCKNCGGQFEEGMTFCTKCGQSVSDTPDIVQAVNPRKKKGILIGGILGILILAIIAVVIMVVVPAMSKGSDPIVGEWSAFAAMINGEMMGVPAKTSLSLEEDGSFYLNMLGGSENFDGIWRRQDKELDDGAILYLLVCEHPASGTMYLSYMEDSELGDGERLVLRMSDSMGVCFSR